MRPAREIGLLTVMLLSMSCSGITGVKKCGPESRGAYVTGQIPLADSTSLALGGISISEGREPGRPETEAAWLDMYAQNYTAVTFLGSDFLRGHVTKIEVTDSQTPSRLLGSYPVPADVLQLLPPNLFHLNGPYGLSVSAEDGRALLVSGQLILQLETDLSSQPLVRIPLTLVLQNDLTWVRMTGEGCG